MTAHLETILSSFWSLLMTLHWLGSFRTVTSLLTDRRLRSWLSGAVLTAWSLMLKTVEMIVDFRRQPPALPTLTSWTAPLSKNCIYPEWEKELENWLWTPRIQWVWPLSILYFCFAILIFFCSILYFSFAKLYSFAYICGIKLTPYYLSKVQSF